MSVAAAARIVEREARVYRRLWKGSVFSTFLLPVLFLAAMGRGLGGLVDQRTSNVGGMSYLHFVTPGLLAASAMQIAANYSLWPVMAGTKWVKFFHGVVATPVSAADLYDGFVLWGVLRAALASGVFLLVAVPLGGVASGWAVLAWPAAILTAVAFAAPLAAFAATQATDVSFGVLTRLVIMPLFLFSGTFFPITQLPGWLQVAARFSPLWHAAELTRAFTTGRISLGAVVAHVAVLAAIITLGVACGRVTFTRRLAS